MVTQSLIMIAEEGVLMAIDTVSDVERLALIDKDPANTG